MDRTGAAIFAAVYVVVAASVAFGLVFATARSCPCWQGNECIIALACPPPWSVLPYAPVIGVLVGAPAAALSYGSYRRGLVRPPR